MHFKEQAEYLKHDKKYTSAEEAYCGTS